MSLEKADHELAAASGGSATAACNAGADIQTAICVCGSLAVRTAGASLEASPVTGGGVAIATAIN